LRGKGTSAGRSERRRGMRSLNGDREGDTMAKEAQRRRRRRRRRRGRRTKSAMDSRQQAHFLRCM